MTVQAVWRPTLHVISLDRDATRFAQTHSEFARAGLGDLVTRFRAIDGQAEDFVAPGYTPHSWGDRWELKRSEQAVFESHRAVWEKIAKGQGPFGIVCEDDILVSDRFPDLLGKLDLARFGIVKIDGFSTDRRYGTQHDMNGWIVRDIVEPVPSAACYALSKVAATRLVDNSRSYCATLDDFVFARRRDLSAVQIDPAGAVQRMCCRSEDNRADESESLREGRDTKPTARGPLMYRIYKEARRGVNRFGLSRLALIRPALADDLPPYRDTC